MTVAALRLGTRKSPMAMFQSRQVASMITERTGRAVELAGITTFGDASRAQLAQIGGTGVFVSGLRACLLVNQVDLAVHSLKDLPVGPAAGIVLAAVPPREDPRDSLVARDGAKLADLPPGARIGTGSPRRAAQLLLLRPDVRPVPVRGNAGTRLGKVESGELDAVLLAYAGLARIGRLDAVTQVFEPDEMLPAAGQGALAVECREPTGKTWQACWPARMTRRATRRPRLSAACSPRCKQAAAPRSARMPPEPAHCACRPSSLQATGELRCAGQRRRSGGRGHQPRPRGGRRAAAPRRGTIFGRVRWTHQQRGR